MDRALIDVGSWWCTVGGVLSREQCVTTPDGRSRSSAYWWWSWRLSNWWGVVMTLLPQLARWLASRADDAAVPGDADDTTIAASAALDDVEWRRQMMMTVMIIMMMINSVIAPTITGIKDVPSILSRLPPNPATLSSAYRTFTQQWHTLSRKSPHSYEIMVQFHRNSAMATNIFDKRVAVQLLTECAWLKKFYRIENQLRG